LDLPIFSTGIGLLLQGMNKPVKEDANQKSAKGEKPKRRGFKDILATLFDTDD